jgi:hypothetical protein
MARTRTQISRLQYASVYRTEVQTHWDEKKVGNVGELGLGHAVSVFILSSTIYNTTQSEDLTHVEMRS